MASNKISMPQSGGGLITYYDEFKSKIILDKKWIIIAIVVIAAIELFLNKSF
jgi:preprotein translocase subunit Sec61beta